MQPDLPFPEPAADELRRVKEAIRKVLVVASDDGATMGDVCDAVWRELACLDEGFRTKYPWLI